MKKVKILIVDDHELIREGLRSSLSDRADWLICDEAVNGRDAITKTIEHHPDVVILDFAMPELNGLEAARQILKVSPNTEVLVLTMHNSDRLAHELIGVGVKGFIFKSDAKRYLFLAIEALSRHETFFTPEVSTLLLNAYLTKSGKPVTEQPASERLTNREREIVQLVAEGKTTKETAQLLGVSEKTIETHRANILRRLHLRSAIDLVRYAIRNNIVEP